MSIYRIALKPLGAYFFGGERTQHFTGEKTQIQSTNPYFVKSEPYLRQTTAFGALRFLGIRNPKREFSICDDDKKRIGARSFNILGGADPTGQIRSISPVLLENGETGNLLVQAPQAMHYEKCETAPEGKVPRTDSRFAKVATSPTTVRWLPMEYDHKDGVWGKMLSLTDGAIEDSPFSEARDVRVGINLQYQGTRRKSSGNKGYFKKEHYVLRSHSFVFFAHIDDSSSNLFFGSESGNSLISLGQGKSPFAASWQTVDKSDLPTLDSKLTGFGASPLFPVPRLFDQVSEEPVDDKKGNAHTDAWWAFALSDVMIPQEHSLRDLVEACMFMSGGKSSFRQFTTRASEGNSTLKRFDRFPERRLLLSAGATMLFKNKTQKEDFKNVLGEPKASEGGYNRIVYAQAEQPIEVDPALWLSTLTS